MWHRMRQGLSKVAEEESEAKNTGWVKVTRCPGEQQAPQWQRLCVGEEGKCRSSKCHAEVPSRMLLPTVGAFGPEPKSWRILSVHTSHLHMDVRSRIFSLLPPLPTYFSGRVSLPDTLAVAVPYHLSLQKQPQGLGSVDQQSNSIRHTVIIPWIWPLWEKGCLHSESEVSTPHVLWPELLRVNRSQAHSFPCPSQPRNMETRLRKKVHYSAPPRILSINMN